MTRRRKPIAREPQPRCKSTGTGSKRTVERIVPTRPETTAPVKGGKAHAAVGPAAG